MTEELLTQQKKASHKLTATDAFRQNGLPTRKNERWKYTDLSRLLTKLPFNPIKKGSLTQELEAQILNDIEGNAKRIVFVDGYYNEVLSQYDKDKVVVKVSNTLPVAIDYLTHPMAAAVLCEKVDFSKVEIKQTLDEPLIVLHYLSRSIKDYWVQPQLMISVAEGVNVIIEEKVYSQANNSASVFNALTMIQLEQDASASYVKVDKIQGDRPHCIYGLHVFQKKGTFFSYNETTTDAQLARQDIHIHLNEANAGCKVVGACFLAENDYIDQHVIVEHGASFTESDVIYRAVAQGQSKFICNPKVIVHPDVKGISAKQSSKNLLIDQKAEINTKPELEIYSDDVQCSHGATIGQLDEQALFYLESRGIDSFQAKKLLIEAFLKSVIDDFNEKIKDKAAKLIDKRLSDFFK